MSGMRQDLTSRVLVQQKAAWRAVMQHRNSPLLAPLGDPQSVQNTAAIDPTLKYRIPAWRTEEY
jgi:hypothetical protein